MLAPSTPRPSISLHSKLTTSEPRVLVEGSTEALQLPAAEEVRDRAAGVPDDVRAGVGDVFVEVAPLPRGGEHRAENLECPGRQPSRGAPAASNRLDML